jgi:hypothetical protein
LHWGKLINHGHNGVITNKETPIKTLMKNWISKCNTKIFLQNNLNHNEQQGACLVAVTSSSASAAI